MDDGIMHVYPPHRLVAQFADGTRRAFDGFTEEQALQRMESAQSQHGEITWYDGVTDEHYENGMYHKMVPPPPEITMLDLTDYTEKEE